MKSRSPLFRLAAGVSLAFLAMPLLRAPARAQTIPSLQESARRFTEPEIRGRIEKALAVPALRNATIGVLVRSVEDGRTLYERNADLALLPASNMKLLTASTALAKLGTDFRYTTTLLYTGKIDKNGTLNGDLYLRGSGDPSLSSDRLLMLADDLRKAGVKKLNGRIVADASAFDDNYLGDAWTWDDEPYYYSAQVAGLNCDENTVALEVLPSDNPGDPATVRLGGEKAGPLGFTGTTYFNLTATVITVSSITAGPAPRPALIFTRARARNDLSVSGTIPRLSAPVTDVLTVEDPPLFTATRLAEVLSVYGIALPPAKDRRIERGRTPPDAVVLAQSQSGSLNDLLKHFLKESDNLYGEALLKTVGGGTTAGGAAAGGAAAVQAFLQTAGIPSDGLRIADGSGLSRMDNVTPRLLVSLLIYDVKQLDPAHSGALETALPVGGVDGTLAHRFKGTPAEGQIRGKTGSLSNVSALSGLVRTRAGEPLVFSLLMNNYAGSGTAAARAAQDAVVLALMDWPKGK